MCWFVWQGTWTGALPLIRVCVCEILLFIVFTKMCNEADHNNKERRGGSLCKPLNQKIAAIVHAGRDPTLDCLDSDRGRKGSVRFRLSMALGFEAIRFC